jgi:hypothetical protein
MSFNLGRIELEDVELGEYDSPSQPCKSCVLASCHHSPIFFIPFFYMIFEKVKWRQWESNPPIKRIASAFRQSLGTCPPQIQVGEFMDLNHLTFVFQTIVLT